MAEVYDQENKSRYDEDRLGLPSNFTLVRAAGQIATTSLDDEYDPSPERRASFMAELQKIEEAERQELIDSRDCRF